jgi:hypothetical protein
LETVEMAARCCVCYSDTPPKTLYINPRVLLALSNSGLWELPQVAQAQVSGTFRVLRRLHLRTGVVDVKEDPDELLFRFE